MRANGCIDGLAITASTSFAAPSTINDSSSIASSSSASLTHDVVGAPRKRGEERVDIASSGPPLYDVFLGGSCGNTVWRREVVIPYLKKRSISYYDPQRTEWSENMIYEESVAKENSSLFLFVLDPATVNATSCLEIAYFAARKAPKLVVVFLGQAEWSDKAHPLDLPDRLRTCDLLDVILTKHSVPTLNSISDALDYIDEVVIGEKSWREALANPMQRMPYITMKTRRVVQNVSIQLRSWWDQLRLGVRQYGRQVVSLLAAEVLMMLVFYFYFPTFPIAFLIVPFLIIDYVAIIGSFVFYRYKDKWKKAKNARRVIIPSPPVPRMGMTAVNGTSGSERKHLKKQKNGVTTSNFVFYDAVNTVNKEVCEHFMQQQLLRPGLGAGLSKARKVTELSAKTSKGMRYCKSRCGNIYVGYDVFLSCSSSTEIDWINQRAIPQLHKSGLTYTSSNMCDKAMEDPLLHTASHILYYIPSYKTFLSGIIQIAYFLGHSDWQVTVCVPTEAESLEVPPVDMTDELRVEVERRNESYRMAFRYLKDMAQRRQCRVFNKIEEAIKYISSQTRRSFDSDQFLLTRDDCRCADEPLSMSVESSVSSTLS